MQRNAVVSSHRAVVAYLLVALCFALSLRVEAGQKTPSPERTVTLAPGQAVNFASGKVTVKAPEADMVFKYLLPQPGAGEHYYNAITRRMEYRMTARIDRCLPLLKAAKTGSFKTPPDLSKLTAGDVNNWTDDEYDVGQGRYLLVRGATEGKHYLLHITKLAASAANPLSWRLTFTYKPVNLALGAPGAAGKGMSLSGTVTYLEWIYSKKIIDVDLATGRVAERFDGYAPSRNARGEMAYVDQANRIVIVGPAGRVRATLPSPLAAPSSFTRNGPEDVAISPDGARIAVQVKRAKMLEAGGFHAEGTPLSGIAVIDRSGRELAFFHEKTSPTWTSDGRLVVAEFVDPGIYISDRAVSRLEKIPNSPDLRQVSGLAVSPDGNRLAFAANGRVWVTNLDGTALKQLTSAARYEASPTWSPDGRYIAMRAQDTSTVVDRYELAIVRIADGKTVSVVDDQGRQRLPNSRILWR